MKTVYDVVSYQLCCGCGACVYMNSDRIKMADIKNIGRRPVPVSDNDLSYPVIDVSAICPGLSLDTNDLIENDGLNSSNYFQAWGPVLKVVEGYSTDDEIRYKGSSGGVLTALALYCKEQLGLDGVLHTGADEKNPIYNKSYFSVNRDEMITRAGSRYSPSSPCELLNEVKSSSKGAVLIGKPCDVAAVQKVKLIDKDIKEKLYLTLGLFCAGVPSTEGTLSLLESHNIDTQKKIDSLKYRGCGWPGHFKADGRDKFGKPHKIQLTYSQSWGFIEKYRQWRCYICPDHTGIFADISVGDPWYKGTSDLEEGKSLIVVRTQLGLSVLEGACQSGYLRIEESDLNLLPNSQPNLLRSRGSLWARLITLKLFLAPVPKYKGFNLFCFWASELGVIAKVRAFTGTIKRLVFKRLWFRIDISS